MDIRFTSDSTRGPQARGRNGWFTADKLQVWDFRKEVCLKVFSKRQGDTAPIILRGDKEQIIDALERALDYLRVVI